MTWHLGPMASLDFESSDKDPMTARIVTCALIRIDGRSVEKRAWLLSPGIPMEPGAIAVHGITDEYAAEHGMPAEQGVTEIAYAVAEVVRAGVPLVGHNLGSYDLNLLNHECARHGLGSLEEVCGQPLTRVLDTMVLDRHAAPYRRKPAPDRGPYTLRTACETYGLAWDEESAHGAEYDALQAAQLAWWIGEIAHRPAVDRPEWVHELRNRRGPYDRFDSLAGLTLDELHEQQIRWAAAQTADYVQWRRSPKAGEQQDPHFTDDGSWPLRPLGGA